MAQYMIKYPQSFYKILGEEGCYAICLTQLANEYNRRHDIVTSDYALAIYNGCMANYIELDRSDYANKNNLYVRDPCGYLMLLTGKRWEIKKTSATYKCKTNEYAIDFYSKNDTDNAKGIGHFSIDGFEPLQASQTIKTGKIYSRRVFKLL